MIWSLRISDYCRLLRPLKFQYKINGYYSNHKQIFRMKYGRFWVMDVVWPFTEKLGHDFFLDLNELYSVKVILSADCLNFTDCLLCWCRVSTLRPKAKASRSWQPQWASDGWHRKAISGCCEYTCVVVLIWEKLVKDAFVLSR